MKEEKGKKGQLMYIGYYKCDLFSPQTTDLLTQAMTELSQTLTTDYRTPQGDYQRIQYIPVSQAGGSLSQPQHIQLQVVQVAPVRSRIRSRSRAPGCNCFGCTCSQKSFQTFSLVAPLRWKFSTSGLKH